ncbi:MAG: nucleotidyl transferase AbiEii/AbiGii toxin family protein [Gammaproteobacteria bacterium]|nr:nucleotidyl transferase AbiEii/AbiGii toxin family protein [Gammaproteobacteria bacterium]
MGLSRKARNRLMEELKEDAGDYIRNDLATCLATIFEHCKVIEDEEDADRSTLLVQYPSLYEPESDAYVAPRIKIEGGARSALDPHAEQTITPYIQEELGGADLTVDGVRTLAPERTLLEKALILHGWHCGYRDQEHLPDDRHRLSRHYYDIGMMAPTPIADWAFANLDLLNHVRDHTLAFFRRSWMKLEEAQGLDHQPTALPRSGHIAGGGVLQDDLALSNLDGPRAAVR